MGPQFPHSGPALGPEAREAAEAAARAAGLTLEQWLSRVVFSQPGVIAQSGQNYAGNAEEMAESIISAMHSADKRLESGWSFEGRAAESRPQFRTTTQSPPEFRSAPVEGLPPTATSLIQSIGELSRRLDSAETRTAQVVTSIDRAVSAISARLDATERIKSVSDNAMSAAADALARSTREQAHAFSALEGSLSTLTQRIERIEQVGAGATNSETLQRTIAGVSHQVEASEKQTARAIASLVSSVQNLAGCVDAMQQNQGDSVSDVQSAIAALTARLDTLERNQSRAASGRSDVAAETLATLTARLEALIKDVDSAETQTSAENKRLRERLASVEARMEAQPRGLTSLSRAALQSFEHALELLNQRIDTSERRNAETTLSIERTLNDVAARIEKAEARLREPVQAQPIAAQTQQAPAMPPYSAPPSVQSMPAPRAEPASVRGEAALEPPPADFNPADFASEVFQRFGLPMAQPQSPSTAPPSAIPATPPPPAVTSSPAPQPTSAAPPPGTADLIAAAKRAAAALGDSDERIDEPGSDRAAAASGARRMFWIVLLLFALGAAGFLFLFMPSGRDSIDRPLPGDNLGGLFNDNSPVGAKPSLTEEGTGAAVNPLPGTVPSRPVPKPVAAPLPGEFAALKSLAESGDGRAQLALGLRFGEGKGGATKDDKEAAQWLQKAADQGLPVALLSLGILYDQGRGVEKDPGQARTLYERAALAGNRRAMHNLAVIYAEGTSGDKDYALAAQWFKTAAELGYRDSQFNLAVLYERGLGVPENLVEAYKWFSAAAAQGDKDAKAHADVIEGKMKANDLRLARNLASAFRPKPLDPDANIPPEATQP